MTKIELEELFDNALDWIYEHCKTSDEYLKVLSDIGLTEKEIKKEKELIESWE